LLIKEDVRNNSAWNERWFAVHRGKQSNPLSPEVARLEAAFVLDECIYLDPDNESTWQYLIGILREQLRKEDLLSAQKMVSEYVIKVEKLRDVFEERNQNPDACVNLTSGQIDLLEMIGDKESLEKVSKVLMTN
jgi:protein farnesyltransferase/geranylgeranyltransferase type-1 subunit alpha